MSTALTHNLPTTLKANVIYALPSELNFITSAGAVEVSLDKINWTALVGALTGAVSGSLFIRATADTLVVVKEATSAISVPGSGGGGSSTQVSAESYIINDPTGTANSKLWKISGLGGQYLNFDAINDDGSLKSRLFYLNAVGSVLQIVSQLNSIVCIANRNLILTENPFANLAGVTDIGALATISDSVSGVYGAIVVGGGTNNVLARRDAANWRVVSSSVATSTRLTLPETNFADIKNDDKVKGTLLNIKNSITDNPGQVVVPGGNNSVLARYDGTNWIVII